MSASTKLSTAVKALCFLALQPGKAFTSNQIALGIGINASKLRRLFSLMANDNIMQSVKGSNGGFHLSRDPEDITIQEVYCAIEDRKAFHLDVQRGDTEVQNESQKINHYFLNFFADIQVDIENKMQEITIQSIVDTINRS